MNQFPTLAEFELMPFEAQLNFYQQKIKDHKFGSRTPFWVERLQTAVQENAPTVLLIFPTLAKFYFNLKS